MCSVIYRLYSTWLLRRLDRLIDELSYYQAAFLSNRSADDHIFTVRRISEENWRCGKRIYIVSLDLSKAFDTIDMTVGLQILKSLNLPHHLINRIVKCCFWERTAVLWYGALSQWVNKSIGVKQGCPISPRIFTLVLDAVMQTLSCQFNINLNQSTGITLPCVLAYADDILLIDDDECRLTLMFTELVSLLDSVGLKLNPNKTEILIRDPNFSADLVIPTTFQLGPFLIKRSPSIRYLGSYLSSNLSRKITTQKRCCTALGVSQTLAKFIRQYKLSTETAVLIYKVVVCPLMIFGIKAAALTKANREKLTRYERYILSILTRYTHNKQNFSRKKLLQGKTVGKKVVAYRIRYWTHILRRPSNHLLKQALAYRAPFLKTGRPCYTWNTSLNYDFQRTGVTRSQWEECSQDREAIKRMTDEFLEKSEIHLSDDTTSDSDANSCSNSSSE